MNFDFPKWVVFQVTQKCDLKCKMCYEWGENGSYRSKKELAELDINVVEKIIEDLAPHNPYFELFGGEPLMYKHLERILQAFKKHRCKVDIPTNGTLLKRHANALVDNEVRRIWVSIDGSEEFNDLQRGKGVYRRAVDGLEEVYKIRQEKNAKFPLLGVTMVVTPLNYKTIKKFFTEEINYNILDNISVEFQLYITQEQYQKHLNFMEEEFQVQQISCASGLVRDISDFQEIDIDELMTQVIELREFCVQHNINIIGYPKTMEKENLYNFYHGQWDKMHDKRKKCSFPWIYMEISANGDVSPCHTFYEMKVGNIYEQDTMDIWKGEVFQDFRKKMRSRISPICYACSRYYSDL
jgi:radical SAM protein with 4Fe4S-binding SPASM domain